MPGKFIHTNEITVYLGSNYYVERSAKQALEILDRRKQGNELKDRMLHVIYLFQSSGQGQFEAA